MRGGATRTCVSGGGIMGGTGGLGIPQVSCVRVSVCVADKLTHSHLPPFNL